MVNFDSVCVCVAQKSLVTVEIEMLLTLRVIGALFDADSMSK